MVNASLNWASIIGIVLAAGGAMLYFMRSFKPALARDYDVFFAAIGLLCGGILFFQGWRLDPILQFGQFLLAGSTIFFAYESVRLRGVTTEQARRVSYFDDEETQSLPNVRSLQNDYPVDRFDQASYTRRRIGIPEEERNSDNIYRRRISSRPIIPERAVSRRESRRETLENDWGSTLSSLSSQTKFGERRVQPEETRPTSRRPIPPKNEFPQSKRLGSQSNYTRSLSTERDNGDSNERKSKFVEKEDLDKTYPLESSKAQSRTENKQINRADRLSKTENVFRNQVRDNSGQFDD
ncbi:MAG TPA: Ycf66 family protein [Prochlorococcaceae cyanobacterium AMR_MDS_5431]|nr:Ycf66 family protein [Prochlorococcaceae cyanobacterium AMR_MDS_5431]